jgi:adenylate cyclase
MLASRTRPGKGDGDGQYPDRLTGGCPEAMKEQGVLHLDDQGYWEKMDSISGENPPECLEEVIETIISRLPEKIRLVLEAACVEGCEFTVEVIASVLGLDRMELIRILNHELDRYHLIAPLSLHQSGPHRLTKFRFCHSLYQKCLYDHLDQVERAHYHKAIGENLEQIYNDQADQISIQLAWHFERAGNLDKTVEYLKMAGRRARRIGADREAAWFFQHGSGVVNDR